MTPTIDQPLPGPIGRYQILGCLGSGGMGTVYRAHDPHLDRMVALKVPRLDGPPDKHDSRVQRFAREARAAARVLHPHVCPIFDVGEHEGAAFVVMAYVDGSSLSELLNQRGRLEVREAVPLVYQVLDGLAAVHQSGIVHRDIKPGNILIDQSGRAILTDFGLARPEEATDGLTSEGAVMGTPSYMAPEQAAGQVSQIGPWTDLYALGVVLYQILTGKLPFEGPVGVVLSAVLRDEPVPPRQHRSEIPAALEAIILRALRKDPRMRFVDARDFMAALTPHMGPSAVSISQTVVLPAQPAQGPVGEPVQYGWLVRRAWWLPGALVVSAASFGLSAMLVSLTFGAPKMTTEGRILAPLFLALLVIAPAMLLGLLFWHLVEVTWSARGVWLSARCGWSTSIAKAARRGVPLDLPDEYGETALMQAAGRGMTAAVKALLMEGVDVNAVSSLGQTAIEIAYAKGHTDIVALLQKDARPPKRPARTPCPQPSARYWLVGSALVGALALVLYCWVLDPWPSQISLEEVERLLTDRQVKTIQFSSGYVWGTVYLAERNAQLAGGRFRAPFPERFQSGTFLKQADPKGNAKVEVTPQPPVIEPAWWAIVIFIGCPVVLAALVGWPVGATNWFPVLRNDPPARKTPTGTA